AQPCGQEIKRAVGHIPDEAAVVENQVEQIAIARLEHPPVHEQAEHEHSRDGQEQQSATIPALQVEMSPAGHQPAEYHGPEPKIERRSRLLRGLLRRLLLWHEAFSVPCRKAVRVLQEESARMSARARPSPIRESGASPRSIRWRL